MSQDILVTQAINDYAKGDFDKAETLFRQVLSMDPAHAQSLYFLGLIASGKGVFDEASRLLYQATLLEPNNADYAYSLAVVLQENNKEQEAVDIYKKLPNMPESWNNLGNIALSKNDFEQAFACFDKALELNPKMIWAMVNKAIVLRKNQRTQEAVAQLLHALKIDERFIPALYQLSICYRQIGQNDLALTAIKSAVTDNNAPDFAFVEYGKVLLGLKQVSQALDAFDKAIETNRFCQDAYFEKALILSVDHPEQAEEMYRDLIRINPSCAAAYNNLGSLLYNQGRTNEALEMYRQVVILNPHDMSASFNLAVALEDLSEYEEATGLYFNVLCAHQYENETHLRLSAILPRLYEDNKELALRYAEGWVKNFPDNAFAVHTLASLSGKADTVENNLNYTHNLYDAFADTYEEKMSELACSIPAKMTALLNKRHFQNALDLGCGTGLSGKALRPLCDKLTGVDLSQKMLEKAQEKNVYDKLVCADIQSFLSKEKSKYDLIVAADVFCYIYQLNDVFDAIFQALKKGGIFVFTIESTDEKGIQIIHQGRYCHPLSYIQNALEVAGFTQIEQQKTTLRKEGNGECAGVLFAVCK